MKLKPKLTIADHFALVDDPRIERTKQHKLLDIITGVNDLNFLGIEVN